MATGYLIRKNQYYDSIFLMRVASELADEPGVQECAVLMATDANKEALARLGVDAADIRAADLNDLVIALQADDASLIERLLGEMDARLTSRHEASGAALYRSVEAACDAFPQANLVVISTPGAYAAREARKAIEQGKHVFLFSDNVPLEQEIELLEAALPAAIAVTSDIHEPRLASMCEILKAGRKPTFEWSLAELGVADLPETIDILKVEAPPRVARKQVMIEGSPEEAAKALLSHLRKEGVL